MSASRRDFMKQSALISLDATPLLENTFFSHRAR